MNKNFVLKIQILIAIYKVQNKKNLIARVIIWSLINKEINLIIEVGKFILIPK